MNAITYTFPIDFPVAELRGVTATGGVPSSHKGQPSVVFQDVNGQMVVCIVAGKPGLAEAVAAYREAEAEAAADYAASLKGKREALAIEVYNTYSPDDFPGSKRWLAHKRATDALAAFDAAHP